MNLGKSVVQWVQRIKQKTWSRTYHIEYAVAAIALIATAIISKKWFIEWIGVLAVFLTFCYIGIADRLQEREHLRQKKNHPTNKHETVECYYKLPWFYYAKETCRTIYFVYLWARSALVWVGIFLLYWPRRKLYRKYHPIG